MKKLTLVSIGTTFAFGALVITLGGLFTLSGRNPINSSSRNQDFKTHHAVKIHVNIQKPASE